MADPRLPEADPRLPEGAREEALLPDDLDQTPGIGRSPDELAQHGSEDARLLAGASAPEGDVEDDAPAAPEPGPDDLGPVND